MQVSMSKIYPTQKKYYDLIMSKELEGVKEEEDGGRPRMLTVWKRSSMSFQGTDGFTVFDEHGKLVYRVDNYSRNNRCVTAAGLVLMDGAGNALLSLKPQMLSIQYQWNAYREEEDDDGKSSVRGRCRVFSMMRKSPVFFHSRKDEAEVYMGGKQNTHEPDFRIEGSFRSRNCRIRNGCGQVVAKIARKRVNSTIMLSDDVFILLVQPAFPTHLVMAFVIILDRICSKPFAPVLCS